MYAGWPRHTLNRCFGPSFNEAYEPSPRGRGRKSRLEQHLAGCDATQVHEPGLNRCNWIILIDLCSQFSFITGATLWQCEINCNLLEVSGTYPQLYILGNGLGNNSLIIVIYRLISSFYDHMSYSFIYFLKHHYSCSSPLLYFMAI